MSDYDPKAARAKRPCPIWADAILRDCGDLGPAEFGAYILIILKMWSNRECGVPDHDRALATISRVSLASWRRNLGPRLARFFHKRDGWLYQKRLLREAAKVEAFCLAQHARKIGNYPRLDLDPMKSRAYPKSRRETFAPINPENFSTRNPPNRLRSLTPGPTGDEPRMYPIQEANSADADASKLDLIPDFDEALDLSILLDRCEAVLGEKISRMTSFACLPHWVLQWRNDGAQDFDIVVAMVGWARRKRRSAPSSPAYFWPIIQDTMRRRTAEREDPDGQRNRNSGAERDDYLAAFLSAAEHFHD